MRQKKSLCNKNRHHQFKRVMRPQNVFKLSSKKRNTNVCTSKSCQKYADQLVANMNMSVNPCESFFQFTCGKYLNRPIPSDLDQVSSFKDVEIETEKKVTKMFRNLSARNLDDASSRCWNPMNNLHGSFSFRVFSVRI